MPTSTKYSSPESALTTRELSDSTRQNSVESDIYSSLNTLDDDVDRIEALIGVPADTAEAGLTYTSTRVISDAADLVTNLSALDAAMAINASIVETVQTNLTGTVSVVNNNLTFTVDTGTDVVTTSATHDLTNGQPVSFATDGTLPAGLSTGTVYYAGTLAGSTFKVYPTEADAIAETNAINISTTGSGTHNLDGTILYGDSSDFVNQLTANNHVYINSLSGRKHYQISSISSATKATLVTAVEETYADSTYKELDRITDPITHEEPPICEADATQDNELVRFGQIGGIVPSTLYIHPEPAIYLSASTIKVKAGKYRDSTNAYFITLTADKTVDITSSGLNGLDTSTEAINTTYFPWIIGDSTGVNPAGVVFSASASSPTLPSGYDIKRRLNLAVRNDGSGNFIPFVVVGGWPFNTFVLYKTSATYYNGAVTAGALNVLAGGTAATMTGVSCTALIPSISKLGYFQFLASSGDHYIQTTGDTNYMHATGGTGLIGHKSFFHTDTNQSIDYKKQAGSGGLYVDVLGYVVTEIA